MAALFRHRERSKLTPSAAAKGLRTLFMEHLTFDLLSNRPLREVKSTAKRLRAPANSQPGAGALRKVQPMSEFGIRRKDLGELFGSEQVARRILAAGWLKPVIEEKNLVIYDRTHCAKAWSRVVMGEELPKLEESK